MSLRRAAKSTRFKSMHLFGGQEAITSMRDAYTHRSASLQGLHPSSLVALVRPRCMGEDGGKGGGDLGGKGT